MPEFDINKVQKYVEKTTKKLLKSGNEVRIPDDNAASILFFFDKNQDGIVTKQEYLNASAQEYSVFAKALSEYKSDDFNDTPIYTYEQLGDFFSRGAITRDTLSSMVSDYIKPESVVDENGEIRQVPRVIAEDNHLKDIHNMTEEEIKQEADSYGITVEEFKSSFHFIRQERYMKDQNSDIVDGHIGTFNQGNIGDCTLLAKAMNLSDEEWQSMYTKKVDKHGREYYEVRFPSDKEKQKVVITAEELDNHVMRYKGTNVMGFSTGDKDVMLLEMAYVKRYGADILTNGAIMSDMLNKFSKTGGAEAVSDITEETLMNGKEKMISLLSKNQLEKKNIEENDITLDSGTKVRIRHSSDHEVTTDDRSLTLPDGTKIYGKHAYSVVGYDAETKILTIKNPHESGTDLKVPFEALKLFGLAEV